ncbi:MAG: hypothetical protein IT308_12360 [Anaerolineaceae bacterium]|nr:hypothetical protein [Anaerolineaceae bacterium]
MKIINTESVGDLYANEDILLTGTIHGNIYVLAGGNLAFDGKCNGIIIVKTGGIARISGNVGGYVFNMGGELYIDPSVAPLAGGVD